MFLAWTLWCGRNTIDGGMGWCAVRRRWRQLASKGYLEVLHDVRGTVRAFGLWGWRSGEVLMQHFGFLAGVYGGSGWVRGEKGKGRYG